ncbi:hypothetical protein MTO96_030722, partial [Rhipicephalus appendiculatus]
MSRAEAKADGASAASAASSKSGGVRAHDIRVWRAGCVPVILGPRDGAAAGVPGWRMQCPGAVPGVGIPEPSAECGPHFLKCHQFLENPEGFLARERHHSRSQCAALYQCGDASRRDEEYDVHAASVLQLLHGGLERRGTRSCLLLLPDKRAALHAVTFDLRPGAPVCLAALFPMKALADLWLLLPLTDLTLARVALVC